MIFVTVSSTFILIINDNISIINVMPTISTTQYCPLISSNMSTSIFTYLLP